MFWNILFVVHLYYTMIIMAISYECIYLITLYFKLCFRQVNNKMLANIDNLGENIKDFNKCCTHLNEINESFKNLLFIYYYLSVPIIDFGVITVMLVNGELYIEFVLIFVIILSVVMISVINKCLSGVARESHRSYSTVHSIICRHKLPISLKLKTVRLVERLSGRVIGFYCYDLFPFTNYEIYLFCVNCIMNFMLFMGLINNK